MKLRKVRKFFNNFAKYCKIRKMMNQHTTALLRFNSLTQASIKSTSAV